MKSDIKKMLSDNDFKSTQSKNLDGERIMIIGNVGIGKTWKIDKLLKEKTRVKNYDFSSKAFENKDEIIYFLRGYKNHWKFYWNYFIYI